MLLICGISSSGKSTYLAKNKMNWIAASKIDKNLQNINDADAIHYNLLRYCDYSQDHLKNDFSADPILQGLLKKKIIREIHFIYTSQEELLKRILLREHIENDGQNNRYPALKIFNTVISLEYINFIRKWAECLSDLSPNIKYFLSANNQFTTAKSIDEAIELGEKNKSTYSHNEKEEILTRLPLEYQTYLPNGESNRTPTWKLIKKYIKLENVNNALDIGSANGQFCFLLEKEGINNVIGLEPKAKRYNSANMLKAICNHHSQFYPLDFHAWSQSTQENFDLILLLNVIHHMQNPISDLLAIANRSKKYLVMEYPTVSDPKLMKTLVDERMSQLSGLPIIAVSLKQEQDQTYLFTDNALKRILIDNEKIFTTVKFLKSPLHESRSIAIFYK